MLCQSENVSHKRELGKYYIDEELKMIHTEFNNIMDKT